MKNILSLIVLAGLATAYTGDLTYYSAGLGSCGLMNTDSDAIVAPLRLNGMYRKIFNVHLFYSIP